MVKPDRALITRARFLGFGLSAALLSPGISPFVAKAQTVNFGAATSGKLSDYCRGDGSDETDQINKCLNDNLFVEIDEPPAGVGYGFRTSGAEGRGLLLRSGHEISGLGAMSKLLRVGRWQKGGKCFANKNDVFGNSSIKIDNVHIEGYRYKPDVPSLDSDSDSTAIAIRARGASRWCKDIELTRVEVHNWPGVSMRIRNGSGLSYTDVKSVNPARGGIVFNTSRYIELLRVESIEAGDDAFAFYVTGVDPSDPSTNRPIYGITMESCESFTRIEPQFGASLKFAGAREAVVTNSTFRHGRNSLVVLTTYPGGFHPKDIRVKDCKLIGGMKHSLQILADRANLISARRNYMYGPQGDCVNVTSLSGKPRTFDVGITDNTLVAPGSGRHVYVQENLSGVWTKGNRSFSSEAKPTISNVSPAPDSRVADATPTIKATVQDRVTNLSKSNIRLYVAGKAVPRSSFYYDRAKNLLTYTTPRLPKGRQTVRIVATDEAGKSASKGWSFTTTVV